MSTSDKGTRLAPPPGRTKTQLGAHTWVTTLLCLLFAIMYLDRGNLSAAAGAIRAQFGLSNTQIGIAFSAFSWAYLASVLFGGWCARRYGARITLLVTVFLVGLGTMATGLATGVVSLFLVRLVVGAGEGPAFPAATHAMRNWYPQRSFGWIQGITHSASRLGGALAPPIVALIIGAYNWQVSFVVCGLASLLWAVLWWSYFRDDPRQHAAVAPQRLHELSAVASTHGSGPVPLWALTRRMLPVTAVMFAYGWCYWIFMSWLPLYFANQHHQDLRSSAFLSSLTLLAGVISNTLGGVASDYLLKRSGSNRWARVGIVIVSLLGCALFLTLLLFTSSLALAVPLIGAAVFFLELTIAPMYAVPMDMSRDYAGMGSAYIIMGVGLAGIVSPIAFGWLVDASGSWNLPFGVGVGILLSGAALASRLRPDRPFQP